MWPFGKKKEQSDNKAQTVIYVREEPISLQQEKATKAQNKYTQDYADGNGKLAQKNEENFLHSSDLVFACIDYIAKAASQAVPRVYKVDRNTMKKERVSDKRLLDWEIAPNPFYTWGEMIELIVQGLALSGTSYLTFEKVKGRYESWFLVSPSDVKIVPDARNYIAGVIFKDEISYKASEVIIVRNPTLNNAYYGVPSVRPLFDSLLLEADSIESLKSFYEGSSLLSGIIEAEFAMNNEQIQNLRQQFKELFGKRGRERGGTAVLPGKMKYKPVQASPADAKLIDSLGITDERVMKVFKINPQALGGSPSTPTHIRELMRTTFNTAVRPYLYRIQDQITLFLQQTLKDPDIIFEFDLDRVVELETALDVKTDAAKTLFATGVATLNEARDLVGLSQLDVENADKNILAASMYGSGAVFIQDNTQLIPNDGSAEPAGSTDPEGGKADLPQRS